MGVTLLIASAAAAAFLAAGLDPNVARPGMAAVAAIVGLACLAFPNARRALLSLYQLHCAGFLAFTLLLAVLTLSPLGLSHDAAWHAQHAGLQMFALLLLAGAAASVAAAYGRTQMVNALLLAAIGVALLVLVSSGVETATPFGRVPPHVNEPALAAAYGVVAILAIFLAADELRRRPNSGGRALPPLSRRLFVPLAALTTSFGMLLLGGSASALAATAIGGVAFAGALALRARRSRVGMALVPAVAGVSAIAAALAAFATGAGGGLGWIGASEASGETLAPVSDAFARWGERPLLGNGLDSGVRAAPTAMRWLAETGVVGAGLSLAVAAALGIGLAFMADRGRPFSRGFMLFSGLAAFTLAETLLAPDFDQPAPAFALAIAVGVALSYLDFEATSRARRKPDVSLA